MRNTAINSACKQVHPCGRFKREERREGEMSQRLLPNLLNWNKEKY